MYNIFYKAFCITLFILVLISCEEKMTSNSSLATTNSVSEGNSRSKSIKMGNCSWCSKEIVNGNEHFEVGLRNINGNLNYIFYSNSELGGTGGLPGEEVKKPHENQYEGLFFCSLKCLNELASSHLLTIKYTFLNINSFDPLEGLDENKVNPFDYGKPVNDGSRGGAPIGDGSRGGSPVDNGNNQGNGLK